METLILHGLDTGLLPVVLTLPRLLAIFAVVPYLSGRMITGLARNGLVLLLAMFFAPVAVGVVSPTITTPELLAISFKEALIGLMLGLGFGIFIWAIQSVGDLIDFQTGSGNAQFYDPISEHDGGPTGNFLSQLAITLFIAAGGLLGMLGVVVDSYRIWPVTEYFPNLTVILEQFVIREGDTLFQWIVKLATPVLLVLLLVELGIGLISRFVPQLNVFVFAQPVKSLLANLMMVLFLFFLYEALQDFLRPENGVLAFLRAVL